MDTAFYRDALFAGMTANAFKLGTVLHLGWFWPRLAGCSLLYCGESIETIDFGQIVAAYDFDVTRISPPDYLPHESNTTCFYVLRRANGCGDVEQTLSASAKISIDGEGNLVRSGPNSISTLKAHIVQGNEAELTWFYCPLAQQSQPVRFNVYSGGGAGQIDFQNPLAQIEYRGRRFYTFTSNELSQGKYLFAVKAQDEQGVEGPSLTVHIEIEIVSVSEPIITFQ